MIIGVCTSHFTSRYSDCLSRLKGLTIPRYLAYLTFTKRLAGITCVEKRGVFNYEIGGGATNHRRGTATSQQSAGITGVNR